MEQDMFVKRNSLKSIKKTKMLKILFHCYLHKHLQEQITGTTQGRTSLYHLLMLRTRMP